MVAQGLVKTKYTSSRYSTNEKRGGEMLTVKSTFQMQQSVTPMTPQGDRGKKTKKLILFYFVLPAKKLVHESREPMERQNAIFSPL